MTMTDQADGRSLRELQQSVLTDVATQYAASLAQRHLADSTIERYLRAASHFALWLGLDRTRSCSPVREDDVRDFLTVHLRQCRCAGWQQRTLQTCRAALHQLIATLRDHGSYEDSPRPARTPVGREIELFDSHLLDVCGAAQQTRLHRTRHVRGFLVHLFGEEVLRHEMILPESFGQFLATRAGACLPSTLGVIADGLRSYVRFLVFHGRCGSGLLDAVPRVARWKLASLPEHLDEGELHRFLQSFDRCSARGSRDYAMALILVTLGLRASEVAALQLSDIDWRVGILSVSPGKTRRGRVLPLPSDVGSAIIAYLKLRPQTTSKRLFVHIGAREGTPVAHTTVRSAIRLGYARAGLPSSYTGTHILRHTTATRLVASGASVKEIADVLGHASIDSTAIYAKVDIERLRGVALPWPELIQ